MNISTKTVLVIEDETLLRNALQNTLNRNGFEVITAEDGEEGLKKAIETHPDVILLDILMPKKDGWSVMGELRKDEWGGTVPVIILTNYAENDPILSKIINSKPAYYLLKASTDIDEVVTLVAKILE